MPIRRVLATVAGAAAVSALSFAAAAGPIPAAAAGSGTETFTTDVLPGLSSLAPQALDPATFVQVGITLSNPNAAAQDAAFAAIYTPGSQQYHHFLTPQQVAAQFGVPESTFSQLVTWAQRDGLHAVYASNTREYLLLQGTALQAESTFSVNLQQYTALGKTFYANTNGPTVPAGLDIDGVIGLNDFLASHTFNHRPPATAPHGAVPQQTTCATYCVGLTTPQDMWTAYDQPGNLADATENFGQGQQMGVLGEGAVQGPLNDLRAEEKEFGLPQVPITIAALGDTFQDTSGSGEWDIDSQSSTGMAPKVYGETWFFANDLTDSSVETDFAAFQADPTVMEANASFGECEEDPTSAATGGGAGTGFGGLAGTAGVMFTQEAENTLQQATIEGKTLFASTGDTGSSCPVVYAAVIGAGNGVANQAYPETNYPASSRYVVAVGGTVLYLNSTTSTRALEYAWNYSGGGNTFYIPEPSYQAGIAFLDDQDCVSQPNGTPYLTPTPCRGIPDVSAQSGDIVSNGYSVVMGGVNDSQGAGTSLASPLWMGMWARIQAATSNTVSGHFTNGFANPSLYKVGLNTTEDATAFFDVGGLSESFPNSNGYYTTQFRSAADPSGWDYVSGLGSPDVCNLTKDIDSVSTCNTLTDNVSAPAPQDCGQPGLLPCSGGLACDGGPLLWDNGTQSASPDLLGNTDPQLSLVNGSIALSGSTLVVTLTVQNLTYTVPTGAAADEWYMLWTYNGTTYFANAELTADEAVTHTPTYDDGTVTMTGTTHTYNTVNTDTGSFNTGAPGTVVIDVPVANVGSPAAGQVLQQPSGETDIEVGVPHAGGFLEKVDTGGPTCDYKLGYGAVPSQPSGNVPDLPAPLTGIAVAGIAGGLFLYRRRRSAAS
jgi:pseudomonalisin